MCKILRASDAEEWRSTLVRAAADDLFFQPEYLRLNEIIIPGEPECFVYSDRESLVVYPYLRRPIGGTPWSDITSAYGYGGFIAQPRDTDLSGFHQAFCQYCRREGIVSEFIRFHPAFDNQTNGAANLLELSYHQPVVSVDYTGGGVRFEKAIKKEVWKKLRRAEQHRIQVIADESGTHTEDFIRLYEGTMEMRHAAAFYYFDHAFFRRMRELLGSRSVTFVALREGQMIGGLLVLFSDSIGYNFLSCSDYTYNHLGTNELLQFSALEWAKGRRLAAYLLGGGRNGEDSLFQFKAKFSPERKQFFIGKRIHSSHIYRELCNRAGVRAETPEGDWGALRFPLYRN